jgi:hypothetical protein
MSLSANNGSPWRTGFHPRVKPEGMLRRDMLWFISLRLCFAAASIANDVTVGIVAVVMLLRDADIKL